MTSPDLYSGLSRGQFLSKTGSCKTFDNAADGYCRADGIGTVVLKRLKDAQSDRDNVLATILGAGTNHSAQAISITHPHAATQSDLYRQVLQQAGVDPHQVSYVEMHGTGTQAGDGTEMKSVTDVFAPASPKAARARDNPLYVGAIKANVGHGEASSGVISLIKAMTILNKSQIPPHAGIKGELNVGFPDLEARNVRIASRLTPFPETKGKKKTILVNNFSAAGGNTALLIQEPPETPIEQNTTNAREPRTAHPVTVSGHTQSALLNNLDRLIAFLESHAETSLLDLSYTTTARRRHHSLRATVVESSTAQILQSLQLKRASLAAPDASPKKLGSVVFMFTGQGAAYPALARDIYNTSTQFRADVAHFDGIARQQGFPSFLAMITDASLADIDNLSPTQTQIGLVCIQVALARLWSSFGVKPSAVVGHSLGEYAALQVAGVLSVSDMILLVGARARLLESKCERNTHSMLAVAAPASSVTSSVGQESLDGVDLACANTPRECVYAGEKAAIERLAHKLSEAGIRSTQLRVPYAFHSAQVDGILDDFGKIASVVNMGVPHTTVISPTSGTVLQAGDKLGSDYLLKHCRQTVQFEQAIKQSCAAGIITDETAVIEIGPHPICSGMVRSTLGGDAQTLLPTLNRKERPWNVIVGSLAALHDAGLTVNWSEYQRDFETACRLILLPSYAFDNKNYWIEYRNNWTLRKGEPAGTAVAAAAAIKSESSRSRRISSSVHRVVAEEDYDAAQPEVVFETDLSDLDMHTAVSGHRVNGSALCPSSLYADMALTIAKHIRSQPSSGLDQDGHDVCDMQVTQPLIINPHRDKEDRTLRITARIDKARSILSLVFSSCGPTARPPVKHAECRVEFGNPQAWSRRWSHDLHLVNDRIAGLKARAHSGTVSNITKKLAYRLFGNLVDYAPDYQRMSQVWLDSAGLEAAAVVALDRREADAGFGFSPYHLDGLLHLSGFVMNGNDAVDASEAVYISHGWQSLRVAETLEPDLGYTVYVKMIAVDKTMVAGNVYVVRNDEIVAFCEGLRFQRVPRAVLDMLLPPQPRRQAVSAPERRKASPPVVEAPPDRLPLPVERELRGPPAQATAITTSAPPSQSKAILQVIANELGLVEEDLKVSDRLSDLGIDSLMSLALTGQLVERFGVHVHHFELMQCVTIQDLVDILLARHEPEPELQHAASLRIEQLSGSSSSGGSSGSSVSAAPPGNVTPPTRAPTPALKADGDGVERLLYDIILEETGMEAHDFQTSTALSDLGVDSLMSLAILAKLREAGHDLSPTIFLDNHTVDDVFRVLAKGMDADALQEEAADEATLQKRKSFSADSTPPQAQCILLQKASWPSSKQRSLFLFPDGSGSPSAYAALETLDATLNVYGLVCPFVKTPSAFTEHGIEGTAAVYVKTLLAKCPVGAGELLLGGWSVGGVLAYDAARQLSEIHGRQVDSLVLIDAPCPLTLPPMNKRLIRYLDSLHLFATQSGQRNTEKHRLVLEHFDATVASLGWYKPAPITTAIRTFIVWARDGVAHGDGRADPTLLLDDPIAKWILQDRENLGAFGWDGLLPEGGLELFTTAGDHFSMMGSNVGALSSGLRHILKNN